MRTFIIAALVFLLLGCTAATPKLPERADNSSLPEQPHAVLPPLLQENASNRPPVSVSNPPGANGTGSSANSSIAPIQSPPNIPNSSAILYPDRLQVYYYYSRYCGYCKLSAPLVEAEEARWKNRTEWHKFDVFTQEGYNEFDRMARKRNLSNSSRVVPILVAKDRMLIGFPEINSTLSILLFNLTQN